MKYSHLAPTIPEYRENVEAKFNSVNSFAISALSQLTRRTTKISDDLSPTKQVSEPRGTDKLPFSVRIINSPTSPLEVFGGMFGTLLEVLGTTGIVCHRPAMRNRMLSVRDETRVEQVSEHYGRIRFGADAVGLAALVVRRNVCRSSC